MRGLLSRLPRDTHFDDTQNNAAPWIVFLGGLLPSSLLAAALALLVRPQDLLRNRTEALDASLSTDLERLAQVVQRTRNAVPTTDREQRIDRVNEGFTRLTGYSAAQALGKTVDAVFGAGAADAPSQTMLAVFVASGQGCRVELPRQAGRP